MGSALIQADLSAGSRIFMLIPLLRPSLPFQRRRMKPGKKTDASSRWDTSRREPRRSQFCNQNPNYLLPHYVNTYRSLGLAC